MELDDRGVSTVTRIRIGGGVFVGKGQTFIGGDKNIFVSDKNEVTVRCFFDLGAVVEGVWEDRIFDKSVLNMTAFLSFIPQHMTHCVHRTV